MQARAYGPDLAFVRKVLEGDETAADSLRRKHHAKMYAMLCARGASETEAEDLIADIWSDCFRGRSRHPALLSKYGGRCALQSWLVTVALNRLIALKRRQRFQLDLSEPGFQRLTADPNQVGPFSPSSNETAITDLLLLSLRKAFSLCTAETVLMLKLVHLYDISQREIGRMWRWHESKVCRQLNRARNEIKACVLSEIQRTDPWLKLTWEDFVQICADSPDFSDLREVIDDVQVPQVHRSKKERTEELNISSSER